MLCRMACGSVGDCSAALVDADDGTTKSPLGWATAAAAAQTLCCVRRLSLQTVNLNDPTPSCCLDYVPGSGANREPSIVQL